MTQSYPLTFVRRLAIKANSYSGIFSPQISRKKREKYTLRFTPPAYCMFSDDIVSKSDGRNGCSATIINLHVSRLLSTVHVWNSAIMSEQERSFIGKVALITGTS